jgi:hypothetical protein
VKEDEGMPEWMRGMAHNIAVEYFPPDSRRAEQLERDIINAMKEAAREVALFFAANPEKASCLKTDR